MYGNWSAACGSHLVTISRKLVNFANSRCQVVLSTINQVRISDLSAVLDEVLSSKSSIRYAAPRHLFPRAVDGSWKHESNDLVLATRHITQRSLDVSTKEPVMYGARHHSSLNAMRGCHAYHQVFFRRDRWMAVPAIRMITSHYRSKAH